jgi:DNA-binding transcriptional LysR family regulator
VVNIEALDLNLLKLFDAVYRTRNVSRAAELLGLSQPATSQALTRLRLALHDPLFERAPGGVKPTERAERLARAVQTGLAALEAGLREDDAVFDPATSNARVLVHLTDIGEARFLPRLMAALHQQAPQLQVHSTPWPQAEIAAGLDSGALHFAIGFLPDVTGTARIELFTDRYLLLLREGHPFCRRAGRAPLRGEDLAELQFAAVRSHTETLRILQLLRLEHRLRLLTANFLALPAIVRDTDLGVLMPRQIAMGFEPAGGFALIEPMLPLRDFRVALHWSRRHEHEPMLRWIKALLLQLFGRPA